MKKLVAISSSLFLLPALALAQTTGATNILSLINLAGTVLNKLIPILIALALIIFFWGLVRYVLGNAGGKESVQAKNIMIAGITALFVMVSIWGIIRLVQNTLGVGGAAPLNPPYVPL